MEDEFLRDPWKEIGEAIELDSKTRGTYRVVYAI